MNAMILLAQGAMNMADSLATANPVLTEVNAPEMNMLDMAIKGGWIMIVLGVLSVVCFYILFERNYMIRKAGKEDPMFMERIKDYIHSGEIKAAINYCRTMNTPSARMIEKGISRLGRPINDVQAAIENVGNIEDKPWGSSDPKIYGTVGTMFMYKGWELNAHLYYKYGGYIYNQTLVDKVENVNPNENGDRRILYDRWNEPGDVAKFKKVSDVSVTNPTSRFVEKEICIQLQALSVSYDFRSAKLKEWGIQRLKISAIGNDVFTSSTVRMERGTSYPFARTFSLAAQITF